MRFAAPTMPKARARLEPTTSITVAPTTASTICVSMTGADRGGVPRRRGRNASAAPSTVAIGSESSARSTMSKCDSRTCGNVCASSGGGGCMSSCRVEVEMSSARRLVHRPRAQCDGVVNLFLQLPDIPIGVAVRVVPGAKGVTPLLVGQARHQLPRPLHVGRANHRHQLLMATGIIELDVIAVDRGDESMLLEALEAVAARVHLAGLTEGGAEIAYDKPARRAFSGFVKFVDAVVVVLQVRAVEHQQHDQQPVQLVGTDQRILLPPPVLVESMELFQLRAKTRFALDRFHAVAIERPRGQVVDRKSTRLNSSHG